MRSTENLNNGIFQANMKDIRRELHINNICNMLDRLLDAGIIDEKAYENGMKEVLNTYYSQNPIVSELI